MSIGMCSDGAANDLKIFTAIRPELPAGHRKTAVPKPKARKANSKKALRAFKYCLPVCARLPKMPQETNTADGILLNDLTTERPVLFRSGDTCCNRLTVRASSTRRYTRGRSAHSGGRARSHRRWCPLHAGPSRTGSRWPPRTRP